MAKRISHGAVEVDVIIIGAGPAGRWLAALLANRGRQVAIIDPHPSQSWQNTHGIWLDQVMDLELPVDLRAQWSQGAVRVESAVEQEFTLCRAYGCIDNNAFKSRLSKAISNSDAHGIKAPATKVVHRRTRSAIYSDEECLAVAPLVVDASEGMSDFVDYEPEREEPAFQRAYGLEATFDGDPLQGREFAFLDYRPPSHHGHRTAQGPSSFSSGMHLGNGRYFIKETTLVSRRPTPFDILQRRLHRRLETLGATPLTFHDEEYCHIPMGTSLPTIGQRTLAFGRSAGFVHPATGESMARMLHCGPVLADVIDAELARDSTPAMISRRAWEIIWPAPLRRARSLLILARDILLDLDLYYRNCFFQTFFALPNENWRTYMSGEVDHGQLSATMSRLFQQSPADLRWALARHAIQDGWPVQKALPAARAQLPAFSTGKLNRRLNRNTR